MPNIESIAAVKVKVVLKTALMMVTVTRASFGAPGTVLKGLKIQKAQSIYTNYPPTNLLLYHISS